MDEARPVAIFWTVAFVAVIGAVAYTWRASPEFANISSILGLGVSVGGFAITIVATLQTRKKIREAVDRVEDQARRSMDLTRREVSRSDHANLIGLLRRLLESAEMNNWNRALLCAELSPALAGRLAEIAWITVEESKQFWLWADALRELEGFIRNNRMQGQAGGLGRARAELIRSIIGQLDRMDAKSVSGAMGANNAT